MFCSVQTKLGQAKSGRSYLEMVCVRGGPGPDLKFRFQYPTQIHQEWFPVSLPYGKSILQELCSAFSLSRKLVLGAIGIICHGFSQVKGKFPSICLL